ncbi:hypothetical protein KKF34_15095 [Myxococcota bacterium]|nr:hypothetical protein [Myxococcota bacterium]MBU1380357.1 hypothetical protein [Myxococcota bacterium]MBU1498203.1 hypothetical protein [Myxococcota bacterium]
MFQIRNIPVNVKLEMSERVLENIAKEYASDASLMEFVNLGQKKLEEIRKSAVAREFSEITAEISEADEVRDNAYRSLIYMSQAYISAGPVMPGYSEANEIYKELTSDGMKFLQGSMHGESDIIRTRLGWLLDPQRTEMINKLNLKPWIENLENAQNEFDRLYAARKDRKESLPSMTPFARMREMDGISRTLFTMMMQKYSSDETHKAFAPLWEASSRHRSSRKPTTAE